MAEEKITWLTDAGVATLLPTRGRVLQVSMEGRDAFWGDPRWTGDWNAGGDRLWVGPEVAWFWKTLQQVDFRQYEVPRNLDPGSWEVERTEPFYCRIRQQIVLHHQHRVEEVHLEVGRSFRRVELAEAPFFAKRLAYRTDNELWIRSGPAGQRVDLWSLLQVPNGGEMIVGCQHEPVFRDYFTPIPRQLWSETPGDLRFQITGKHQYKIGVAPSVATGRLAYVRRVEKEYLAIYREIVPQPGCTYCDVPLSAPDSDGDAVQVYNDSGESGGFGELEYHSPAIAVGQGVGHLVDTNLTVVGLVLERDRVHWQDYWLGRGATK